MSRSRRKSPFCGLTSASSEKEDKQIAHRIERRRVKRALQKDPEDAIMPHKREVFDPWNASKDGRQLLANPRNWRVPKRLKKYMRK